MVSKDVFTTETPLTNDERIEAFRRKNWTNSDVERPVSFLPKHLEKFLTRNVIKNIPDFLKRQAE